MATSCKFRIKYDLPYHDLRQNSVLANDFSDVVEKSYGMVTNSAGVSASVDFGNVSYGKSDSTYLLQFQPFRRFY